MMGLGDGTKNGMREDGHVTSFYTQWNSGTALIMSDNQVVL
jgi:hypothetical protein